MNIDYQIANAIWRFYTNVSMIDNIETEIFRDFTDIVSPDWKCHLEAVSQLPKPQGRLVKKAKEQRIYLEHDNVWLELLSRENEDAWFVAKYRWDYEDDVQLWILDDKRPYTVRMEHIWSAVDFPFQLLKKDILTLHSAVTAHKEEAILFLAPSGTGKSTQAALWEQYRGAKQVNGDKAGIYMNDERVKACGLPFCGTSGICEDYELPVKAFVVVTQAKENKVTKLRGVKALTTMLANCFGHPEIPQCQTRIVELLGKVLEKVPVYLLACTPDVRAVEVLEECLQEM